MSKITAMPLSRLALLAGTVLALGSATAYAQTDIPDRSSLEAAASADLPPPPASEVGGLGPEDDPYGLEEGTFDFDKTPQQLQEEVRSQAFNAALEGLLPLRPEEIRILLERYDRTQESVKTPIYPSPKPLSVIETLSMDPGTAPTVIKTAPGHITTVNFIDLSGQPWPINNITWAGDFEVVENKQEDGKGDNILRITASNEYARGNMSITMIGLSTPIVISLTTDRDEVHYRFDATVPERGPFADVPIIDRGVTLSAGRADISGLLQGLVPSSADKMNVGGVDGRTSAYSYNGLTYIRTPLTLLSPAWSNSVTSADGMKVYEIQNTPVVLLSDKGKMVRAQITDREELLDE